MVLQACGTLPSTVTARMLSRVWHDGSVSWSVKYMDQKYPIIFNFLYSHMFFLSAEEMDFRMEDYGVG